MRGRPTYMRYALLIGAVVVFGSATTSYAAKLITGAAVKDGSLTGKDLKAGSVSGTQIAAGAVGMQDLAASAKALLGAPGAAGAQGPPGPAGAQGRQGDEGAQGPSGTDGIDGQEGARGPAGATGPQGPVGPAGPAGTASSASVQLFSSDATAPVADQGSNLPAAQTELDAGVQGTRALLEPSAISGQVQLMVNMRVVKAGGSSVTVSIRDTANTANVLATVTVPSGSVGTQVAKSVWVPKPGWFSTDRTLAVYTAGGNGTGDVLFRNVTLNHKP